MEIRIVTDTISLHELRELAREFYGSMIKGVVDIETQAVAFGGEYHMDANILLIEEGSRQNDVWGFNVYLDESEDARIVCTSLINIRPHDGNRSIQIEDVALCERIATIVNSKII